MLLTVYVLALYCTGLAVVPIINALECATIPEYNTLMALIRHDNCNSINNMFKLLHNLTRKQYNTDCTKQAIKYLAGHFSHSQMPNSCQCKGNNTYVTYYDLTHQGIPSNHYSCREGPYLDKSYNDLYYEFFASRNHHSGDHPPDCRTHHSLWNRLVTVSNNPGLHCLNDLIHHLSYAFEKDGNPCLCSDSTCTTIPEYNTLLDFIHHDSCDTMYRMSTLLHDLSEKQPFEECTRSAIKSLADHFNGSDIVPPQCLCNGHNIYLEYHDLSHVNNGLPSNKISCRLHDKAYHDLFFEFFASTASHYQPPNCRTHHSIWTRLNAVTNDTHEHCLKDFIYHLSYAFTHQGDPCHCSENIHATATTKTTASPVTAASKTTTTSTSIAAVITSYEIPLPECNHTCTLYAAGKGKAVVSANATGCARPSVFASDEALLMVCCSLGFRHEWRKGQPVQQTGVCIEGEIPYYTPVSLYNGPANSENHAGIFVGCIADGQSGFKMIFQDCNTLPTVIFVNGTDVTDPNNYFAIF